ncbi:MAG TPA: LLM class flavin-dependent oxidoreductase [Candidatus Limnocylindrales bacterium]|nr:LLM class flavin-dependent oxidoreductase [Candidatus Limnocylindrales bacterium]
MVTRADLRVALGPVGIWASLDAIPIEEVLRFAGVVQDLGFGALWINESAGREPFAVLGALARSTSRLTLGLGIASTYARDATAAHSGARTIADLSGGRFVMGLGVSHRSSVVARGHDYAGPLATMTAYLDGYAAAPWSGPPVDDPPLVLAALRPGMLGLAAERALGAFPYLVDIGLVREAREILDAAAARVGQPDRPVLIVSLPAILGGKTAVREAATGLVRRYLGQPNYRANLRRGGYTEEDLDAISDRLVDALVATGDAATLRARVAALGEAGADHVAVIPLSAAGRQASLETAAAVAPDPASEQVPAS